MTQVLVAVPAHNEAASITRCVASIDAAAGRCPGIAVSIVVAADRCRDDTIHQVERYTPDHCHTTAIAGSWRGVGATRAAAIATHPAGPGLWIANTDADCVVPPDWIERQLAHAATGIDLVAGGVELDPADTPTALLQRFRVDYSHGPNAGRHVHAANLGIRADTYHALGGWCTRSIVGEDHRLWHAAATAGRWAIHDPNLIVTTSSRTRSRVIGGFATHLDRLSLSTDIEPHAPAVLVEASWH